MGGCLSLDIVSVHLSLLDDEPPARQGTGGEGNILQPPAPMVSAAITHKTVRPTDLTSTYSVCTRRMFGGIEPRSSDLESEGLSTAHAF
ncbi:hypothetical protein TNCV_4916901 [Trichonephila clavipes]|nr:hypothetical protein TNCV_4916901 [Trichonephila clavipes]